MSAPAHRLLVAVGAVLAACSAPGGDAVDAAGPPADAADAAVDAAAIDGPVDAAPDAAPDADTTCSDLGLGPTGGFDELVIGPRQGDQRDVAIAYGGAFFLLTWRDVDGAYGQRVSNTATFVGAARRLGGGGPSAVACLATGACAVALRDPVALVRTANDGAPVDATPIVNTAFARIAGIGAGNNQFMIVYRDAGTDRWRVQRYGVAGGALDANPRELPSMSGATPTVAGCDNAGCLIAFPGDLPDGGRVRVPWVGAIGPLAAAPGPWQHLACTGARCLWADRGAGLVTDLQGDDRQAVALPAADLLGLAANADDFQLVSRIGAVGDPWQAHRITPAGVITAQGDLPSRTWIDARIGCGASICLVAAQLPTVDGLEDDVGVVRVDQVVVDTEPHFVLGANAQTRPLIATSGAVQLVAWSDRRVDGAHWRVARRRPDGTWLDTSSLLVPVPGSATPPDVALTWTGRGFLLSWIGLDPTRALRAIRISTDGELLDPTPLELVADAYRHAIACTQDVCLALTAEPGGAGAEHRLRRLDATTLAPLGAATVLRAGVTLAPVRAAASADGFAVLVVGADAGPALTRVGLDGALVDVPALAVPDAQIHALIGRAAGFAIAGSALVGGPGAVRFVGAAGVGPRIGLVAEATAPVLGSLGTDALVVWKYPDALAIRRFDPAGVGGVVRALGGAAAEQPALIGGPAGEALAAWAEHDPTAAVGARRLRLRRVCGP